MLHPVLLVSILLSIPQTLLCSYKIIIIIIIIIVVDDYDAVYINWKRDRSVQ